MKKRLQSALARTKKQANSLARRDSETDVVPRITTETIASQREEVLKGARKYIYPLQHSKHRIVLVSSGILLFLVLAFIVFTTVSLYRLQSSNTFIYRVTQVLPLPIARQGSSFIPYESYLFELRHYMHYYERQQKLSFASESGAQQLASYKQRALDKVVNDAIIEQEAKKRGIVVTDQE
nr:SurA N-terminal domain-containing protein [bacterium]